MSETINGVLILAPNELWMWCVCKGEQTIWKWNGESWICENCGRSKDESS